MVYNLVFNKILKQNLWSFDCFVKTTALTAAVKKGKEDIVQYLLSHPNIDVNLSIVLI